MDSINLKVRYMCEECSKEFTTKYGLTSHVQNVHNGVKHQCDICGTQYNSRQHLINHKKMHVNESDLPKFSCDFCSFETVRKESLKDHKKGKHSHQTFRCQVCHKLFSTRYTLINHSKRTHEEFDKFPCNICDKAFNYQ